MRNDWQLLIYQDKQRVFACDFAGPLELGRQQSAKEPGPFRVLAANGRQRAVIATLADKDVSRQHALLEPTASGTLRLTNLSQQQPITFDQRPPLLPGTTCELSPPVLFRLGAKVVRVEVLAEEPNEFQTLQARTLPPGSSADVSALTAHPLTTDRDLEGLFRGLQTALGVLQSAAVSEEFFAKAAQAVVALVGLDSGQVLLRKGDGWEAASVQTAPDVSRTPHSQTIIARLLQDRRTLWYQPAGAVAEGSLRDVKALVAAPLLDQEGQVIGALYGERRRAQRPDAPPTIGRIEAVLVELLAGAVAAGLARLEQERAALTARIQFEQFFTPELARHLSDRPEMLQGRDTEVTVLFCDVRGFSRLSERLGPAVTTECLGEVLDELSACVLDGNGVLVDFKGDEVMAMWGAPEQQPDHAILACRAALIMLERLPALNERLRPALGEPLDFGIGINTGTARVGNIGSKRNPEAAFAEVALLRALPGRDGLTYAVPTDLRHGLRRGMRVVAPLGRRRETGIVLGLHDVAPAGVDNIRELEDVLDAEAIVSDEVLELCRWSARYYLAGLADVLAVALPGGLRARSVRVVHVPERGVPPRGALETAIVEHVRAAGTIGVQQLARALARPDVPRVLQRLVARGVLAAEEQRQGPAVSIRYATVFTPARDLDAAERALLERRAARQLACYERIRAAPRARLDASELDVSGRAAAAALVKRGLVTRLREERYRETGETAAATAEPELTAAQRVAVDAVAMEAFQVFLLHGVTGSGKTEVYLQLAARARAAGRSVLMLVPEIALTPQLLTRAQQRFGDAVAVVHSGLAPGQRWDEWRRIARGEARVVVGTRSAVFAPLVDLGLVIVDEEHDAAYKQDEGLRYHGRDLAIVRGQLGKIPVVLGSATPSIESHQQALDGKYRRLTLPERVHGRPLPEVTIVDLRSPEGRPVALRVDVAGPTPAASAPKDPTEPDAPLFSPPLLAAMTETLERREQTLLFLNRRGFASAMHCLVCGEPAGCPSCSVSLTLHRRRAALLCHHCGYARAARAATCAACGRGALVALGLGTERVEAEIGRLFPAARVGRLDRDTTTRAGAHRRILEAWSNGLLDVLIGTQMVAKGHDVPGVTLVGVLLADVALGMPDFRAGERAFQLLTQVAGRAGRGSLPGRVIVQTYRPSHHSLVAAAAHDYASFAPHELEHRRETSYPPFVRLAALRFEGPDFDRTGALAESLAAGVRQASASAGVVLRGPAPAPLERLRGRYRWQLVLSSTSTRALHEVVRALQTAWRAASAARTIRLVVDVDPVSML